MRSDSVKSPFSLTHSLTQRIYGSIGSRSTCFLHNILYPLNPSQLLISTIHNVCLSMYVKNQLSNCHVRNFCIDYTLNLLLSIHQHSYRSACLTMKENWNKICIYAKFAHGDDINVWYKLIRQRILETLYITNA